mgnify:CR=1 FL=1
MVLHGISQASANGFRTWIQRKNLIGKGLFFFAIGSAFSYALFRWSGFVPEKRIVYFTLGIVPPLGIFLARFSIFSFLSPWGALVCGLIVTWIQLTAGAAGALLDIFFLSPTLGRKQVVATKAFVQTITHLMKIYHYGFFSTAAAQTQVTWTAVGGILFASFGGTWLGSVLLERLNDVGFRRLTRIAVLCISGFYLYLAATLKSAV